MITSRMRSQWTRTAVWDCVQQEERTVVVWILLVNSVECTTNAAKCTDHGPQCFRLRLSVCDCLCLCTRIIHIVIISRNVTFPIGILNRLNLLSIWSTCELAGSEANNTGIRLNCATSCGVWAFVRKPPSYFGWCLKKGWKFVVTFHYENDFGIPHTWP